MLKLDNLYTNKAVDALLNYETVKLFNNEALEVSQYDEYLVGYQVSVLDCQPSGLLLQHRVNAGSALYVSSLRMPLHIHSPDTMCAALMPATNP